MQENMSRWGVGPVFIVSSVCFGIVTILLSRFFYPRFTIDIAPDWVLSGSAIVLLVVGVPFFIIAVYTVTRAYNVGALVTDGIFKCCRHPLYASWVVFIVPGIVLLMKSWIGLTTPMFMYLVVRHLVKKEELYLESVFGERYRRYRNTVACILPIGRFFFATARYPRSSSL